MPSAPVPTATQATVMLKSHENTKIASQSNPLASFRVQRVQQSDLADINEFLFGDFLHQEPLNCALDLNREESIKFFTELAQGSLPDGLSYVVRDPAANKRIVAIRLASIINREEAKSAESPFAEWQDKEGNEKIGKICGILHELESKIWNLVPKEVNRLISWVVLSVDENYKRRGIAAALLEYRTDEMVEKGCQGAVTEASAFNSQKLFQKLGYTRLAEVRHSEWTNPRTGEPVFRCKDATDRVTLEFKPFAVDTVPKPNGTMMGGNDGKEQANLDKE